MMGLFGALRRHGLPRKITVKCCWDPEAGVWYVVDSSIPGLAADAESIDELANKIRPMILDLIALQSESRRDDKQEQIHDVPFDLLVHHSLTSRFKHC